VKEARLGLPHAWASLVKTVVARSSSSRSMVAARTRARAASYFFFMSAMVVTMASSFCQNWAASAAWRASSVAKEAARSPKMQRKERERHAPRV
jgi:hypothetical protein